MSALREENIRSLRRTNPALAGQLESLAPSAKVEILSARTGQPVPAIHREGRSVALHSLFDPAREAARLADAVLSDAAGARLAVDGECYLVFEGLGGGYHVRQTLARTAASHVLLLESDPALLVELLSKLDFSDIFADPRVRLLVDPTPDETAAHLRSTYLPAVMGGIFSIPLRARIDLAPERFSACRAAIREALEETANDYTVQAGFGRLWTRNILTNLPYLELHTTRPPRIDEAIVASAGPSLEERMDELARLRPGRHLIAADTSLPALLAAGQLPDTVLTIDCQNLSYHHFLRGLPSTSTLAAELAAPPGIIRRAGRIIAVSSGHPLSRLAAREVGGILPVDTSGGNVGHAAVSFALELGARSVYLLGSDFSYPFGKPYARGTYLFDYFAERERRTAPTEAAMASLIFRNTTLEREQIPGGLRYTTQTLRAYRDRFLSSFASYGDSVHPLVAGGLPLDFPPSRQTASPGTGRVGAPGHATPPRNGGVKRFLLEYRDAVRGLPDRVPRPPSSEAARSAMGQWNVFTTLYPTIARLRSTARGAVRSDTLLAQAKSDVAVMIERVVERWYP